MAGRTKPQGFFEKTNASESRLTKLRYIDVLGMFSFSFVMINLKNKSIYNLR